jgi:hypothetical protein
MPIIHALRRHAAGSRGRWARAALALAAVLSLGVAAIGARAYFAPAQGVPEVRTTLGQLDFEPAETTRGDGPFRLVVVNNSGKEGLTFRLLAAGGEEIYRGQPAGPGEWSREFELPAGQYVLTELNNPAWLFYIKVQ